MILSLHKANIYRKGSTVVDGETVNDFVLKYQNVPCHLSKKTINGIQTNDVSMSEFRYILFTSLDTDIKNGDRVEVLGFNEKFTCQTPMNYSLINQKQTEVKVWEK